MLLTGHFDGTIDLGNGPLTGVHDVYVGRLAP